MVSDSDVDDLSSDIKSPEDGLMRSTPIVVRDDSGSVAPDARNTPREVVPIIVVSQAVEDANGIERTIIHDGDSTQEHDVRIEFSAKSKMSTAHLMPPTSCRSWMRRRYI